MSAKIASKKRIRIKNDRWKKNKEGDCRDKFPNILVFEFGDRTLDTIIKHERIAGSFLSKQIALNLAEAVFTLHDSGYVHGDLKPLNIVIVQGTRLKLIDLDVSAKIGGP